MSRCKACGVITTNVPCNCNRTSVLVSDYNALLAERDLLLAVVEVVHNTIESRQCSDGSCVWGKSEGMHTNGGCQHRKMNTFEARREIAVVAGELVRALDAYHASKGGSDA